MWEWKRETPTSEKQYKIVADLHIYVGKACENFLCVRYVHVVVVLSKVAKFPTTITI